MPTHKIHLSIAKIVNKKLNVDLDSLMLGSVLPDIAITDHDISHYQIPGNYDDELANPDKFIKDFGNRLNEPIMLGYLIHILTDRYYNDYYFKNHCILDENGIPVMIKLRNGKKESNIKKYKHSDFDKYDKFLLKNGYVSKFKDLKCIENVTDLSIATFSRERLEKYITICNNDDYKNFKTSLFYYSISKKELDKVFYNCIEYIFKYLEKLNIIK